MMAKRNKNEQQSKTKVETRPSEGSWLRSRDLWPLLAVAFGTRLLFLSWKAPHFDESINGHFVDRIWATGFFRYDPTNFHGPLYFYLLHLAELLFGRGVESFRLLTGLLSVACVLVVAGHERFLGRAARWAAWVLAVSPAFVFYGRYAIHETLFVLGQLLFSWGFLRWRSAEGARSLVAMVAGFVISFTTKETFFIFWGTWAIAWFLMSLSERFLPSTWTSNQPRPRAYSLGDLRMRGMILASSIAMILALFTGFFVYPRGIADMISAFAFWAKTGSGATGHEKPFLYWANLLWRYEWPTGLALFVAPVACLFGSFWMRLYSCVGVGSWLAYSLIPYKTPWCILGMIWPLAFAFGFVLEDTRHRFASRFCRGGILFVAVSALIMSSATALRMAFWDYEKLDEPYVYVQTTHDVTDVMKILEARVRLEPETRAIRIQVLHREPWPFPWLLAWYPMTEFAAWKVGVRPQGDVIFADASDAEQIEARLKRRYFRRRLNIRDSYQNGFAYFEERGFAPWFQNSVERVGGNADDEKATSAAEGEGR